MAAPSYTTDLADITLNEAIGTWVETGTWTTGTAPALEPDIFIQGSNSVAKYWTTGGGGGTPSGAIFDAGSALTIPSPGAYFVWLFEQCPNNVATYANGGIRVIMGDSSSAFNGWDVGGSDTQRLGGWLCAVVDPAVTDDDVVGAPVEDSTRQWFGAGVLQTATAKGGLAIDALRYGRGELRCTNGDVTNGYASFGGSSPDGGAAAYDMNNARAWGLCIPNSGAFYQQGLFIMGLAGTAVDFRDSNRAIFIANTLKVISTFNLFEIRHASSRVDWTACTFTALGTVSRGDFTVTDNADVNWLNCTFTDVGLFVLKSATDAINCTFRRTDKITTNGALLSGCTIDSSRATTAVLADTPANAERVTGCSFTSAGTGNGLEITGTAANMTLTDVTFTGYSGTSTNAAVYVNIATGSMNLTISGGTDITGNVRTAGCAVTVVVGARTVKAVAVDADGVAVTGAVAFLRATAGGNLPSDAAITSITRSGPTATVTFGAAHNLLTNDKVLFAGITDKTEDNVIKTVTNTGATTVTFVTTDSGSMAYTGTKTGTFIFLSGPANAGAGSNELSMSRSIPATQPVSGWTRKSSATTRYKQGALSGSVSTTQDTTFTGVMISDE